MLFNYAPVLMYHRVNDYMRDIPELKSLTVSSALFERQVKYLVRGKKRFLTFAEYVKKKKTGTLDRKDVCLTFDDGWEDNYYFALPVLQEYGVCATFFIIAGFTDTRDTLPAWKNIPQPEKHCFMSSAQLKTLLASGMEIGGHGLSHVRLTQLAPEEMKHEIVEGKKKLEALLQIHLESFCYPYGDYNNEIHTAVVDAGYKGACVVSGGRGYAVDSGDGYAIERETMAEEPLWKFVIKIKGVHRVLRKIR